MECSEPTLVAFLAGDLSPEQRAQVDAHLLACESCWQAVQEDRAGREALELLYTTPPPGLAERIRLAVELADMGQNAEQPAGRRRVERRVRRRILLAVSALAVAAAALGTSLTLRSSPRDPAAVAALTAMADSKPGVEEPAAGTWMNLGDQPVLLRSYRMKGTTTLVAISTEPFPMPASSHVVTGSSKHAWMATRGRIGLYCVNAAPGRHSMLVAAPLPAVELPSAIAHLHLD